MDLADYAFDLPAELIAQEAVEPRDAARLLVVPAGDGPPRHLVFRDLPSLLRPGDLLVVNDTRVVRARLLGRRASGGKVEVFLVGRRGVEAEALLRCGGRLREGEELAFAGSPLRLVVEARCSAGTWTVRLAVGPEVDLDRELERIGRVPLPPYIQRAEEDPRAARDATRYQTVFAERAGAVAAPTAGLHFTPRLLAELAAGGVELARVTLHVGLGTFEPIRVRDVEAHVMHAEWGELSEATAAALGRTRERGGRVVAVGTTSLRVLETAEREVGRHASWRGETRLFLRPGNPPRSVDALITNFHVPESTLLLLVASIVGRERLLAVYREAIERRYRFYSYGDATFVMTASF